MPFAQVDDLNTQLFYQDSGVPTLDDKPYTTLVVVHGLGYNSHIFHRLHRIAAASHVRLVTLNRRGYAGSTPFSEAETLPIDPSTVSISTEDGTASATTRSNRVLSGHYMTFMQQRGAEMARFLVWFIENERIPPRSDCNTESRASGGISLLGWSLGNATTLSMLAFASTFDPGLMKKLEPYLRKVIIFDPPHAALGYPTPENSYNPLLDPEIRVEERQPRFMAWVSSYFVHSPSVRDPATPLRDLTNGLLEQRVMNPSKKSTAAHFTAPAAIEVVSQRNGDMFALGEHARPVFEAVRTRAIFGNLNETYGPPVLPKVDISYIWCTDSVWEAVLAMRSLQQDIASPPDYHYPARSVRFIALEGGNHFIHYDDPLKAFAAFAQALE
ncbi:Alpha/Beta hydrolase protein [Gautieria morchelliformis]|nr:Alpha/Beta hydrolase protein [Gautieria morchelliformis]